MDSLFERGKEIRRPRDADQRHSGLVYFVISKVAKPTSSRLVSAGF